MSNQVINLKYVRDVISLAGKIIDMVEADPVNDKIFVLNQKCEDTEQPKSCVAGSKAVAKLAALLREEQKSALINQVKGCGPYLKLISNFEPTDTDVFFLNSETDNRVKYEDVDIIHLKATSVESLLLNFDLPNCRAAYYSDCGTTTFYVSLHCLYSMLTGCYYLPSYLLDKNDFNNVYKKNCTDCIDISSHLFKSKEDKLFDRLQMRIEKYRERGYTCKYTTTSVVLPWIKNRFFYGEFAVAVLL